MIFYLTRLCVAVIAIVTCTSCSYMSECTGCKQQYYVILDSTTNRPIADVEAELIARGHFPGIGHPGNYEKAKWHRRSNQNGEFSIPESWAEEAGFPYLQKKGYVSVRVSQMVDAYEHPRESRSNPELLYLTPESEARMAELGYLFEQSKSRLTGAKKYSSTFHHAHDIAKNYVTAKAIARTDAERNFNWSYCALVSDFIELLAVERRALAKVIRPDGTVSYPVNPNGIAEPTRMNVDHLLNDCSKK